MLKLVCQTFSKPFVWYYGLVHFFFSLLLLIALLLLGTSQLNATEHVQAHAFLKRIYAYIAIQDFAAASEEAQRGLSYFPTDKLLLEASIRASAHRGDEKGMWDAWNAYRSRYPEESHGQDELQELMAWAAIWKGADSPQPLIRLYALLGAFFSNDAKSLPVLKRFCRDKNTQLRCAAVKLIGHMRDAQLCDEVLSLVYNEKDWKVRLGALNALGEMKIQEGRSLLLAKIADNQATAEEKSAAIEGLIELLETIDRPEIEALVYSNRASLRLLACEVIRHLRSQRDVDLLMLLASDNHSDVRAIALHTLGLLEFSEDRNSLITLARNKLYDRSPEVAVTAAWLLTLADSKSSHEAFMPLVQHPKREVRLQAAAAIAATGKYGISLTKDLFKMSNDSFFKMNLALGLIYQQTDTFAACQALDFGLNAETGRWMWKEDGLFRILAPSTVKQEDEIANAPEAINQLTRLEILNLLAVMKYPGAEKAIRGFLQQHKWGIAGMASALLLMEGDDVSLNIVQGILEDPDPRIRMQAALTLALWGGKEEAMIYLEAGYATADRETKERIIEGLGRIGSRKSIPFLLQRLQESQQSLRLIAASSLLQCLYH